MYNIYVSKRNRRIIESNKELINELKNDKKVILLEDIIRDTNYKEGNKYFDTFLKHNKNVYENT